jgi:subtilisin family serine protease
MDVRALLIVLFLFLVACSPKTPDGVFNDTLGSSSSCSGQALSTRFVVQWESGEFTVETAPNAESFKKHFLVPHLDQIRKVEYDRVIQFARDADVTVVPLADAADDWGQNIVEASALWNKNIQGDNVAVAIVDSFVDVTHPQISPRISPDYEGKSFISNPTGTTSDHGTHVAGIIAADHTTGYIKGMAPKAKLLPAPFIDGKNGGSIGDAILAMQYVSNHGVKIINASWGGAPCLDSLRNAFDELNKKGILIVVAAGNDGADIDYAPDYPAAFNMPNQLTIAASSPTDFMTSWSNNGFSLVHLAAPGERILSTITNNRVGFMDGTSMSAPFVSGAAALLWSDRPQATVYDIRNALMRSVDVIPNHVFRVQTHGRMNVRKALDELHKILP